MIGKAKADKKIIKIQKLIAFCARPVKSHQHYDCSKKCIKGIDLESVSLQPEYPIKAKKYCRDKCYIIFLFK